MKTRESANERQNKQESVKKTNKDAQMLKHSCYSEGTISTRVEAMKRTRASVADKPPAKRKKIVAEVFRFGDDTILSAFVKADDLKFEFEFEKQQLPADQLKKLPEAFCTNDQLLKTALFPFSMWRFTCCLHLAFHHQLYSTHHLLYKSG